MNPTMQCDRHEPYDPQVVLAVGAHPDDIDFGASGSLAVWAEAGARVEYLVITDGSKGTPDRSLTGGELVKIRQAEQLAAADVLGAQKAHFLEYPDGELEVTMGLKKDIARVIRQVRPDTVVLLDPTMVYSEEFGFINHPDHRAAGQATLDAVFPLARDHLSFPDLYTEEKLEPHKVAHVLLMNFTKANTWIDISGTFDTKVTALLKHVSQIPNPDGARDMLRSRAELAAQATDWQYAEAFLRLDPPA
jgi:LmbE family N-acetylglucosaminyl deacetylase